MSTRVYDYFKNRAAKNSKTPLARYLKSRERRSIAEVLPLALTATKILDAGSGSGFYLQELLRRDAGHITAVDLIFQDSVGFADAKVSRVTGDLETLQLAESFDLILCLGVLEFLHAPRVFLLKLAKWCKPGAEIVLLFPRRSWSGNIYRLFHACHGISVGVFHGSEILRWGRDAQLVPVKQIVAHSFAEIVVFKKNV